MRIKFIQIKETVEMSKIDKSLVGLEYQISLEPVGDTIVNGMRIATNGILYPFVEDITEYRTELDEDGNEIQVEVIPEPIEVDIG